jgi:hypothetical protein
VVGPSGVFVVDAKKGLLACFCQARFQVGVTLLPVS